MPSDRTKLSCHVGMEVAGVGDLQRGKRLLNFTSWEQGGILVQVSSAHVLRWLLEFSCCFNLLQSKHQAEGRETPEASGQTSKQPLQRGELVKKQLTF